VLHRELHSAQCLDDSDLMSQVEVVALPLEGVVGLLLQDYDYITGLNSRLYNKQKHMLNHSKQQRYRDQPGRHLLLGTKSKYLDLSFSENPDIQLGRMSGVISSWSPMDYRPNAIDILEFFKQMAI